MPYDRFVREMLTASGSNFRVRQVNFYRAVQSRTREGIAQAVALTFMGHARRELAQGAPGGHGGLLLADRLSRPRRNGKRRSSSSIPAKAGGNGRPGPRHVSPTARPAQLVARARTRARSSPTG